MLEPWGESRCPAWITYTKLIYLSCLFYVSEILHSPRKILPKSNTIIYRKQTNISWKHLSTFKLIIILYLFYVPFHYCIHACCPEQNHLSYVCSGHRLIVNCYCLKFIHWAIKAHFGMEPVLSYKQGTHQPMA